MCQVLNERYDKLNTASPEDSSETLCAEWLTKVGRPGESRHRGGGCGNIKGERGGCGKLIHFEEV